ncbi:response regulator [Telmatospirillum sp.]|uniref:response regulator n=1 Tax=Telmatospirillum sp. TaxID=2079197 RepID=UPI00283DD9E8|nr:response regulator [Telmatospirillum sp.]MDR3437613.1 response regulator [Telmatospirillum sp.]
MATGTGTIDQLEREIESEFVDETRDVLAGLEVMLGNFESGLVDGVKALATLRRSFRALEARSQSLDKATMGVVSHRASEYLSDFDGLERDRVVDVQIFIDVVRKLLGQIDGAGTEHSSELVRQLPSRRLVDFDVNEAVKKLNIEMMLVIPDRATSHYVERELAACGYRVSNAGHFFRGLELAVRTQPDMVITAAVLDEASGIDLIRAMAGIQATAHTPVALLTSYAAGHPSLADLPPHAAVIRKGSGFGEDLAIALARFKIT